MVLYINQIIMMIHVKYRKTNLLNLKKASFYLSFLHKGTKNSPLFML